MQFTGVSSQQAAIAILLCSVAACTESGDPAKQAPVDPLAGLYQISISGSGLLNQASMDDPDRYCLAEKDRATFPHILAQGYYNLHPGCKLNAAPREGNAYAGEIICPADPKFAQGVNGFTYEGAVGADDARVSMRIKFGAELTEGAISEEETKALKRGMKMLERMRFTVDASRIGDCP